VFNGKFRNVDFVLRQILQIFFMSFVSLFCLGSGFLLDCGPCLGADCFLEVISVLRINEFIKVDMDEFQRRPLDLSSDWEMFEPASQHKAKIKSLVSGTNRYLGKKTTAIKLQSRRNSSTGVF